MAKNLEQIFEECLERVFQGESIESCLMSYPNETAYLEPLLRTAIGVTNRASMVQPDPAFKARAGMRIQAAWQYAAQQGPVGKPSRGFTWQRSWAFALTAVLLLLFSSVGTAFASAEALPDEPLYPVKLATEQVALAFAFSEENKVALHAQLAEKRTQEIAVMAREGKTHYVVATATRLSHQMEQAEFSVRALEMKEAAQQASIAVSLRPTQPSPATTASVPAPTAPTQTEEAITSRAPQATGEKAVPPSAADVSAATLRKTERARELVQSSTAKNIAMLENVMEQAPSAAKPALNRVINQAKEVQQRTIQPQVIDDKPKLRNGKPPLTPHGIIPDKPQTTSDQPETLTPKMPLPADEPEPPSGYVIPPNNTNIQPGITPILPPPVTLPPADTLKPNTITTQPSGTTNIPPGGPNLIRPPWTSDDKR